MSDAWLGLIGFAAALALIALGLPVAIAMAAVGLLGYWWLEGWFSSAVIGRYP